MCSFEPHNRHSCFTAASPPPLAKGAPGVLWRGGHNVALKGGVAPEGAPVVVASPGHSNAISLLASSLRSTSEMLAISAVLFVCVCCLFVCLLFLLFFGCAVVAAHMSFPSASTAATFAFKEGSNAAPFTRILSAVGGGEYRLSNSFCSSHSCP